MEKLDEVLVGICDNHTIGCAYDTVGLVIAEGSQSEYDYAISRVCNIARI